MNLRINFLSMLTVFSLVFLTSCSEDDDSIDETDDISAGCTDFENSYEDVMAVANTYINNPTEENCEDYRQAVINFYESYKDCSLWTEEYEEDDWDDMENWSCSDTEGAN